MSSRRRLTPAALDARLERVHERVADAPATADELARSLGASAGEIAGALVELELLGVVEQADGVYRSAFQKTVVSQKRPSG
jgi:predicted Rossmann fold nucleotide-binding protein DprA/Smf involved in DNA uptake